MKQFNFVRAVASGEIVGQGTVVADKWKEPPAGSAMQDYQVPEPLGDPAEYWWRNGALQHIGKPPSAHHRYNPVTSQWEDPRGLEDFKALKWAEIKAARDAHEFGGFTWDGSRFDSDAMSQSRIQGAVLMASLQPGLALDWTLQDNTVRTLSTLEIAAVGAAMGAFVAEQHEIARQLREQINAAATRAEVEAVAWP